MPEGDPEVDPLVPVAGMVALYNPAPFVVEPAYNGLLFPIRPNGIDLVSVAAADMAVGPSNAGGNLHHVGLRRLTFDPAQNEDIRAAADKAWLKAKPRFAAKLSAIEAAETDEEAEE